MSNSTLAHWTFASFPLDVCVFLSFFFQAEDGIRDPLVTGVQTCALPIYCDSARGRVRVEYRHLLRDAGARRATLAVAGRETPVLALPDEREPVAGRARPEVDRKSVV